MKEYCLVVWKITLALIVFLQPFDSYSQVDSHGPNMNNRVPPVTLTFRTNPSMAGEIYCDDQRNLTKVSNENKTYEFGTKLDCQIISRSYYNFTSWSGIASGSTNPIAFRVLEDGILSANMNKSISHTFTDSTSRVLSLGDVIAITVAGIIAVIPFIIIYHIKHRNMNSWKKRINEICENQRNNPTGCKVQLEDIMNDIRNQFESQKLGETDYEKLRNIVHHTLERIESAKAIGRESLLESFTSTFSELKEVYENLSPLLSADPIGMLKRTSKNTSQDNYLKTMLKNPFLSMYRITFTFGSTLPYKSKYSRDRKYKFYSSGRGGYLTTLLFRRRVKKVLNDVLATSHFYLNNEESPEKVQIIKNIIEKVSYIQSTVSARSKQGAPSKVDLLLRIVPIILAIIAPGILTNYLVPIASSVSSIPSTYVLIIFQLIYLVSIYLIFRYVINAIYWYNKIIRIYQVNEKEANVYDSLISIQRIFIDNTFPRIKGLLC